MNFVSSETRTWSRLPGHSRVTRCHRSISTDVFEYPSFESVTNEKIGQDEPVPNLSEATNKLAKPSLKTNTPVGSLGKSYI